MDKWERYINIIRSEYYCFKYNIKNYTITENGYVDVVGDLNLEGRGIKKLPNIFNRVTGSFIVNRNELTSLEGSPRYVLGDFYCISNKLTSLKGSPYSVNGGLDLSCNKIFDLIGLNTLDYSVIYLGGNPISNVLGDRLTYDLAFTIKAVKAFKGNTINRKRLDYGVKLQNTHLNNLYNRHSLVNQDYTFI